MPTDFILQPLGENIQTAEVLKVLVSTGQSFQKDQIVLELETNKAVFELPATFSGKVTDVLVKVGDKVKVGQVLFKVDGDGKETEGKGEKKEAPKILPVSPPVSPKHSSTQNVGAQHPPKVDHSQAGAAPLQEFQSNSLPFASPSVRKLARELEVDLVHVRGTGPHGHITADDIQNHIKPVGERLQPEAGPPWEDAAPNSSDMMSPNGVLQVEPLPDFSKWGSIERKPMSGIREATARHMAKAWATIPHVTQCDLADITEVETLRKQFGPRAEKAGARLTFTAIVLKVVATALKVFPQFNSSLDLENAEIILKHYIHVGVAVDTDRGLFVPVIRNVDEKNILEIARELATLSEKAKSHKLVREDMEGGTFTITNLGGIGGNYFTPIINSPQVAILGIARSSTQPVWKDGKFEPRLMLPLSLSYDHRLIDGADAARFLRWLADAVQEPFLMDLEG